MAKDILITPVSEEHPCGPDLRWDPEFLALTDAFAAAIPQGPSAVVDAEVAATAETAFDQVIQMAIDLSARTKDLRILAIYAEASWYHAGLAGFAVALDDLASVLEAWPDGREGVHPQADEVDGDLGERAAALGRLLNQIPGLVATVGWGPDAGDREMMQAAATLNGTFASWTSRLEPAFGADLPSAGDAWRALQRLVGHVTPASPAGDEGEGGNEFSAAPPTVDAWDLIDQAFERMAEQDHHSPALPLLRLLSSWRALGIIDIVDRMKGSGVTLEQMMESVKRQTQGQ